MGSGQRTAKTMFGLEKKNEIEPNYQRPLLLTVLSLNYFMPPPRIWAHIRGRYWSANKDDISL
jgi:hypothetical protein